MFSIKALKIAAISLFSLFVVATPLVASAAPSIIIASDAKSAICDGLAATGGGPNCGSAKGAADINKVIKLALTILSFVAGVAAVIMIVVAGIRYITSGGDASGVKGDKEAIIYAIVGIIVVALAQSVVAFVLTKTKV